MKQRTIGILVWDGFLTSEVTASVEVLGSAVSAGSLPDTTVLVVSAGGTEVRSNEGLRVCADVDVATCPPLDVLVVPSSVDMGRALENQQLVDFVRAQGRTVGTLASHCAGAFLLGEAGLLDGRRVTTYPGGHAALRSAVPSAAVVELDVVRDGNLITSSGAAVSYRGALQLLEDLTNATVARETAEALYLDRLMASTGVDPVPGTASA